MLSYSAAESVTLFSYSVFGALSKRQHEALNYSGQRNFGGTFADS